MRNALWLSADRERAMPVGKIRARSRSRNLQRKLNVPWH